jgi:hypothetical protein
LADFDRKKAGNAGFFVPEQFKMPSERLIDLHDREACCREHQGSRAGRRVGLGWDLMAGAERARHHDYANGDGKCHREN